jgi:hypothetical protein
VLQAAALSSLSAPRMTISSASSGRGRCRALASSRGARNPGSTVKGCTRRLKSLLEYGRSGLPPQSYAHVQGSRDLSEVRARVRTGAASGQQGPALRAVFQIATVRTRSRQKDECLAQGRAWLRRSKAAWLPAYLSGTFTAGIGFVGSVMNGCGRGSTIANAKKTRMTITRPRMRAT